MEPLLQSKLQNFGLHWYMYADCSLPLKSNHCTEYYNSLQCDAKPELPSHYLHIFKFFNVTSMYFHVYLDVDLLCISEIN